jgi:outer membrane biosynthesis protein TonB
MPQNPRITESLDPGLDQNALYAASRYRFKPAMRDGEPVPVMVNVKVIFEFR